MARSKTHAEYEDELFNKELNAYPIETYKGSNTAINHECDKGHIWKAFPTNVLKSKGCPTCNKYGKRTDYEQVCPIKVLEEYKGANNPILHKCDEGHEWKVRPSHILAGHSCPSCAKWGFKKHKPAILYYVKLSKDNETYYKIGVTNRTVSERFKSENVIVQVLNITEYSSGQQALIEEKTILDRFPRVNIPGFLKQGYSELFEYDILNMEK